MKANRKLIMRYVAFALAVVLSLVAGSGVQPPLTEAQPARGERKVLFISGWALWDLNPLEYVDPRPDWVSIKEALKRNPLTRGLNLQEDDFLYFSYSGGYELDANGRKDYHRPRYQRKDTSLAFGDYQGRAATVSEIINAFPNATFDLIGHSLGGVVATYWAGSRLISPIPRSDLLLARVNSIVTIDSPLQGRTGPCNLGVQPIPPGVVSTVANAVHNASVLTVRNLDDTVVPPDSATLPGAWRDLEGHFGGASANPCGSAAHGAVKDHLTVQQEIAAAMVPMHIYKPVTGEPASAGLPGQPASIKIFVTYPRLARAYGPQDVTVQIGDEAARITNFRDRGRGFGYELDVAPPPKPAGGLYDLTVTIGRSPLSESDTQLRAVRYEGPGGGGGFAGTATVFVMDISGSMGDTWQGGVKIESAKAAALQVLNLIEREAEIGEVPHQVALVTFSTDAYLETGLTTDYAAARSAIQRMAPTEATNIGAGLTVANAELQNASLDAQKIVILLSDGLTNRGLSPDEILAGPVADGATAGTCIYTVGFGDPGELNEELLRRIAAGSRCGVYYYAFDAFQLQDVYVKLRHKSTGTVIAEFAGTVAQGQETTPLVFTVPPDKAELHGTLIWPGSTLDLLFTDPQGTRLDQTYPGATLSRFENAAYWLIKNPRQGNWQAVVRGASVPEGSIMYSGVVSVRGEVIPPPTGSPWTPLLLITLVGGAVAAGWLVAGGRPMAGVGWPLFGPRVGVQVLSGPGPITWAGFRRGVLTIGRHTRCELPLWDPKVSGYHAQIRQVPAGWVLYDLNSRNGTFVNGQRIRQQRLRSGDRITVGDTEVVFQAGAPVIEQPTPTGWPRLVIEAGPAPGATYPVNRPVMTIGRSPACVVVLRDRWVSGRHAEIRREPVGYVLHDLGSVNGTYANGRRITRHRLRPGDQIQVGTTRFRFRM